jgi:preprotein translocase subunit SecG
MTIWLFLLVVLYVIACVFLIFIILIQSGKGGGLSSLAGASQGISDALGTTGGERFLNKLTTISAVGFVVLAILISLLAGHYARQQESILGNEGAVTQPLTTQAQPEVPGVEPGGMDVMGEAMEGELSPGGAPPPAPPPQTPPQTPPQSP